MKTKTHEFPPFKHLCVAISRQIVHGTLVETEKGVGTTMYGSKIIPDKYNPLGKMVPHWHSDWFSYCPYHGVKLK